MSISLNVVIPMAGLGSRFVDYGFKENKYLLPVDKYLTKMIEKAVLTLNIKEPNTRFIFILREENNIINIELRNYLTQLCINNNYDCVILSVPSLTEGPASTCYEAIHFINNDVPLIISNSDQILDWNFDHFYECCKKYDGCVLTYKPDYELIIGNKDKHSFVRFNNDIPVEFVEKKIISQEALVGTHYYKQGKYFIEAYDYLFENNIRAPNGEFYLSYTYQAMINIGGYNIGTHKLKNDEFFYPVGEPIDYFSYYNKTANLKIMELNHYETINNYSQHFKIQYNQKNENIIVDNELIIVIKGNIYDNTNNSTNIIFLSGPNKILTFNEDTYFLRVFNVFSQNYDIVNIYNYLRGWIIGDFLPSIKKINNFEVGLLSHQKNELWDFHYHKQSIEINILIEGIININNNIIKKNQIFIFDKNIISCPLFLENCKLICIKIPSVPNDKHII